MSWLTGAPCTASLAVSTAGSAYSLWSHVLVSVPGGQSTRSMSGGWNVWLAGTDQVPKLEPLSTTGSVSCLAVTVRSGRPPGSWAWAGVASKRLAHAARVSVRVIVQPGTLRAHGTCGQRTMRKVSRLALERLPAVSVATRVAR